MPRPRQPAFFWQGALILLPVAVLAVVGWGLLRRDQQQMEREARLQAQDIANEFVALYERELTNEPVGAGTAEAVVFETDLGGNLLSPPPWSWVPEPHPLNPAHLDSSQADFWLRAQPFEDNPANAEAAIGALRDFLKSEPPPDFAGVAWYRLGLLLQSRALASGAAVGDANRSRAAGPAIKPVSEAAEAFASVAARFPDAVGESGVPLGALAQLHWLETAGVPAPQRWLVLTQLASNAVARPSMLTPLLLCSVAEWQGRLLSNDTARLETAATARPFEEFAIRWQHDEEIRAVHALARAAFAGREPLESPMADFRWVRDGGRLGWRTHALPCPGAVTNRERVDVSEGAWLALRSLGASNRLRFVCRTAQAVAAAEPRSLVERATFPPYFGLSVEVAGQSLTGTNTFPMIQWGPFGKGGGSGWRTSVSTFPLATLASAWRTARGDEYLRVDVHLTSPQMFHERLRARTRWFGLLIGGASLAAGVGFVSARRAFLKQQRLAEMKTNFVSSVSHELRAPIASVRLMAESLARGKVNEPARQREYFHFILQECRRLSSLIENVLDFARIEQGRKQYEFEPTDLRRLIEETVKLMEPQAAERRVTLALDLKAGAADVQPTIDGRAVQQALVNLLDNALKHSPEGATVTLGLELPGTPTGGSGSGLSASTTGPMEIAPPVCRLYVEDHGPGIPAEEHEKIFERFYRRGSELRRETPGVGIGLSIVKHIVAAHGGRVLVRSAVGQGSRFVIELPLNTPLAGGPGVAKARS